MDFQTLYALPLQVAASQEEAGQAIVSAALAVGRKRHERYGVIEGLLGPISSPVFNTKGDWLYMPLREEDRRIIPRAAFNRHEALENAGLEVRQVIIGHEVSQVTNADRQLPKTQPEIDWVRVGGNVGKGFLVGLMVIARVSVLAISGALRLADPSYCVVLKDDPEGHVISLLSWNQEI